MSLVVVAPLQLNPSLFQGLLPRPETEQAPKRRSGNLNSIVVVRTIGRGNLREEVAQIDQFTFEGLRGLRAACPRCGSGPSYLLLRSASPSLPASFHFRLNEVVDRRVERLAGEVGIVDPKRVATMY